MEVKTESIYNLIPKPKKEEKTKRIYRSKYDPKAPLTGSTFGLHGTTVTVGKGINDLKKTCVISSTFGTTQTKPNPSAFLRKGTRSSSSTKITHPEVKTNKSKKGGVAKPPVPSCDDKPIMGLKTCNNYILANATKAIIQKPKVVKEEELYTKKETYGKVPRYLNDVKKQIEREQKLIDECVREQKQKQQQQEHGIEGGVSQENEDDYTILDEQERHALIDALKSKWDYVNSTYQKICHRVSIDSLGDIKRKEAQEADLQQLEEDIERLSRPGMIYVHHK